MAEDPLKFPAAVYQGLPTGPSFNREYDLQQSIPVDGSTRLLRELSPFTISIVLPDIYKDFIFEQTANQNEEPISVYDNAMRQADDFLDAKDARAQRLIKSSFGFDGGGVGRDVVKPESYIFNGRLQQSRNGEVSEPAITDENVGIDIALQIQQILNVPPLTLLVNPQSMQIQYRKIQQFTDRTRKGYLFQGWGQEQTGLSISGLTGAFIAGATPGTRLSPGQQDTPVATGVQFASKNDSAAWQNLQNLFLFYKHNGYIYDTIGRTHAMHAIGSLRIEYDNWVYIGNMNSFSYGFTDTDNQHGKIQFDLDFTANKMFDSDPVSVVVRPFRSPTYSPSDPGSFIAQGKVDQADFNEVITEGLVEQADILLVANSLIGTIAGGITQTVSPGSNTSISANAGGFNTEVGEPTEDTSGTFFIEGVEIPL